MDDQKYAQEITLEELLLWADAVTQELHKVMQNEGAPTLDVEWLLLRCNDTLQPTGEAARASALQLLKDVAQFQKEFPGVLQVPSPADSLRKEAH